MLKRIITTIFYCLTANLAFGLPPLLESCVTAKFDFYGYSGYGMGNDKIVCPTKAAIGNPWVIRARFWGVEPQVDTALLARGFYVTYCDVADLYGSPTAVGRYDKFYDKMTNAGLNPKVVLEGLSRGGLIVYNWAAANANKVAAIYADAPVMDIKSWPIGKSEDDTKKMLDAYQFTSLDDAIAWRGNPIDNADKVKDIAIIHVVGMADEVVPVADNTDIFKQRVQDADGRVVVIRKAGGRHHPHSLKDPSSIVDFIMVATGQVDNGCVVAQIGSEWRSGAGWAQGNDWWSVAMEIDSLCTQGADVVLLGNSITQGFAGNRKLVPYRPGYQALTKALPNTKWVSAGISGDCTEHLLWRVRNGKYGQSGAKTVFITIGVNNLYKKDTPTNVAEGIKAVANQAAKQFAQARIIVFGVLPFYNIEAQRQVQAALDAWDKPPRIEFHDISSSFINSAQELNGELYSGDMLHLSPAGYEMWSDIIAKLALDK